MKFILLFFFTLINLYPQQITNWKLHSSKRNVLNVVSDDNLIWGTSNAGAFSFNKIDSTYTSFNKSEGMFSYDLSGLLRDSEGKIWFGSKDGSLSVLDKSTNTFTNILDISNSSKDNKVINSLYEDGNLVYISTGYGVTVIEKGSNIIKDSYFKFGNFTSNILVHNIIKTNVFIASTQEGLAIQREGATNLSAPESWINYPLTNLNKVITFNDQVYALSANGLLLWNNGFTPAYLQGWNIKDAVQHGDSLYIISNNGIWVLNNGSVSSLHQTSNILNEIEWDESLGIIVSSSNGIFILNNSAYLIPEGPYANEFPYLVVDKSGNLWSSSGKDVSPFGIYKFDGKNWYNYNQNNGKLRSNGVFTIHNHGNDILGGFWGQGIVRITPEDSISYYDKTNSPMVGLVADTNYLVVTGLKTDSKGNLWVLLYGSAENKPLYMLNANNEWFGFNVPAHGTYLEPQLNLAIDNNDTKWYSSLSLNRTGLFFFNENKTIDNPADDKSGYINQSQGLTNVTINAIAADKRGEIWVGTGLGLNVISNASAALNNNPQFRISNIFSLRQQSINCIAVDAINQKWVGTNQGLVLLNEDGSQLLHSFNTKNSLLPSDAIVSLAIDEVNGIVYAGTNKGLVSFKTAYVKPVDKFGELFTYPSPYIIDGSAKELKIEGLVKNSQIKILTLSGKTIRQFETPGGNIAFWDGKDENGNYVSTGVYFIVAFDREANNIITHKIAIVRK